MFPKVVVSNDVKSDVVKDDIKPFEVKDDIKPDIGIIIERSDNGSNRRQTFVTMRCERSGMHIPLIQELKPDDTRLRKCECPFNLHKYCKVNDTWKFNVISSIHNHVLLTELASHPIICLLKLEEK